MLLDLPPEICIYICYFLDRKSLLVLLKSCKSLNELLSHSNEFWKQLCRNCGFTIPMENQTIDTKTNKCLKRTNWKEQWTACIKCIKNMLSGRFDIERYYLSVNHGSRCTNSVTKELSTCNDLNPIILEECSFPCVFNSKFLVLINSGLSISTKIYVWKFGQIYNVVGKDKVCNGITMNYMIECEDVAIWHNYLVILPIFLNKSFDQKDFVYLYKMNVSESCETILDLTCKYVLEKGFRVHPKVYKESGGQKVNVVNDKLIVICNVPEWRISLFELPNLQLLDEMLIDFVPDLVGAFISIECSFDKIICSFYDDHKSKNNCNLVETKMVFFDVSENKIKDFMQIKSDCFKELVGIHPFRRTYQSSHDYFDTAGDCIYSSVSFYHSKIVILLVNGDMIIISISNCISGDFSSYEKVPCPFKKQFSTTDTHLDELSLSGKFAVVLKNYQDKLFLFANDITGKCHTLWSFQVEKRETQFTERLFLYTNSLFAVLSDPYRICFWDIESGHFLSTFQYPNLKRNIPELAAVSEGTNPYSQMGFSIWNISNINFDKIIVVHDIERMYPLFVDIINFNK